MGIKVTKLLKGQGFVNTLTETNFQAMGINSLAEVEKDGTNEEEDEEVDEGKKEISKDKFQHKHFCFEWYKEIVHYLCFLFCHPNLNRSKYKALKVKTHKCVLVNGKLYSRDPDGVLLLCLTEGEIIEIVNEYHGCFCGGHYGWKVKAHKILKDGFLCPSLFSYVYRLVRGC